MSNEQLRRGAWYETPRYPLEAINVGTEPNQGVFDGTYLWVVGCCSNYVTRINVRTNATSTFTLPTISGFLPSGIALMRYGLAVSYTSNTGLDFGHLVQLNFDGSIGSESLILQGFAPGYGLASDSQLVWVMPGSTGPYTFFDDSWNYGSANVNVFSDSGLVSVSALSLSRAYLVTDCQCGYELGHIITIDPTDSTYTWSTASVIFHPTDSVITGGDTLWVISESGDSYATVPIGEYTYPFGDIFPAGMIAKPTAIATDGTDAYVVSEENNMITRIRPNGDKAYMTFDPNVSYRPVDIVFDGQYFWVINAGSSNVVKVAPF